MPKKLKIQDVFIQFTMLGNRLLGTTVSTGIVAVVANVLGSIPASSDTVESEGRQVKQCWILYLKNPPLRTGILAFSSVPDCLKLQACEPPTAMGRHWNSQLWVSLNRPEKITILKTRAPWWPEPKQKNPLRQAFWYLGYRSKWQNVSLWEPSKDKVI